MNSETQRKAILRVLRDAAGSWVPLPDIIAAKGPGTAIAQYNARIFELRREHNHLIENYTKHIDDVRHSWYRLVEGQGVLL